MNMPTHFLAYEGHHIALPPIDAIPEFTAGLIFGLTGDNHLKEIQHCMEVGQPLIDEYVVGLVIRVTLKVARLIHVEEKQRLWLSGGKRQRLVVMKSHVALEPDDVHVEGDLAAVPGTLLQGKMRVLAAETGGKRAACVPPMRKGKEFSQSRHGRNLTGTSPRFLLATGVALL